MIKLKTPIRKARMEELIEEEASVWHRDYGEMKLHPKTCSLFEIKGHFSKQHMAWCLSFVYKNKEASVDIRELRERGNK